MCQKKSCEGGYNILSNLWISQIRTLSFGSHIYSDVTFKTRLSKKLFKNDKVAEKTCTDNKIYSTLCCGRNCVLNGVRKATEKGCH